MNCPACKTELRKQIIKILNTNLYLVDCTNHQCERLKFIGIGRDLPEAESDFRRQAIKFDHNLVKE